MRRLLLKMLYVDPSRVDRPGESGRARSALLLWLLGAPLPIVLIALLMRGC